MDGYRLRSRVVDCTQPRNHVAVYICYDCCDLLPVVGCVDSGAAVTHYTVPVCLLIACSRYVAFTVDWVGSGYVCYVRIIAQLICPVTGRITTTPVGRWLVTAPVMRLILFGLPHVCRRSCRIYTYTLLVTVAGLGYAYVRLLRTLLDVGPDTLRCSLFGCC